MCLYVGVRVCAYVCAHDVVVRVRVCVCTHIELVRVVAPVDFGDT